jgi:hypothetical protein
MQPWKNPLTERRCDRKKPYFSEGVAKKVAWERSLIARSPIVPYRCPDCGQWHIGKASYHEHAELQRQIDKEILKIQNRELRQQRLAEKGFDVLVVPEEFRATVLPKTGIKVEPQIVERPKYEPVKRITWKPITLGKKIKSPKPPKLEKKEIIVGAEQPENPSPYVVNPGDRNGYMTAVAYEGSGKWLCRCACGTLETRKRRVFRGTNDIDCCRECNRVARWLCHVMLHEIGVFIDTEFFIDEAVEFTLRMMRKESEDA